MSDRTKLPKGTRKAPTRKFPSWARKEIEDAIERLLGLLDIADGDPDLEDSDSAEEDDAAEDSDEDVDVVDQPHDVDDEGNDEPTLGWTADGTGIYGSDVGEDEPSLGSTHAINQEIAWAPQPGLWGAVDLEFDGEAHCQPIAS